jgi:phage terminase large subunit
VLPADKGPDSVKFGINTVRKYKLHVTARSINLIRELRKYKWAVDSSGRPLQKPIGEYNHALDAVRYYAMMNLGVAGKLPKLV